MKLANLEDIYLGFSYLAGNKQITDKMKAFLFVYYFNILALKIYLKKTRLFKLIVKLFCKLYRGKYQNNATLRKKLWYGLVICILKTNSSRSLDLKIGLQLKESSCNLQESAEHT